MSFVAAPGLAADEFECDRPARAGVSAGEEFEAWQGQLGVLPCFHGVAVVERVVRMEIGKQEEQGVPAAKEVVARQCADGVAVKLCQTFQFTGGGEAF